MFVTFTLRSDNVKTGPIPVTISPRSTCPSSCPYASKNEGGCYAENYGLRFVWNDLDRANGATINGKSKPRSMKSIMPWGDMCGKIMDLPEDQIWRHDQAGDLPGKGGAINWPMLKALCEANATNRKGRRVKKRGFTYSHKDWTPSNLKKIREANALGFTVNLSCNSPAHLETAPAGFPLVVVVPVSWPRVSKTVKGKKILVCPAQVTNAEIPGIEDRGITCRSCGLCQSQKEDRPVIAFRAHGTACKKVEGYLAK